MKKGIPLIIFTIILVSFLIFSARQLRKSWEHGADKKSFQRLIMCNVTYYSMTQLKIIKLSYDDLSFHVDKLCYETKNDNPNLYPCYIYGDELYLDKYEDKAIILALSITLWFLASLSIILVLYLIIGTFFLVPLPDPSCSIYKFLQSDIFPN